MNYTSSNYYQTTDTLHIKIIDVPDAIDDMYLLDSIVDENINLYNPLDKIDEFIHEVTEAGQKTFTTEPGKNIF